MDVNLVLFKKDGSQKTYPMPSSITVIGRRDDCDLRIPLADVSRRHCELGMNKESLKIRDLDSRNGTFLNGKRIDEATVHAGDYITIGPLMFLLQINGEPEEVTRPEQAEPKPTAEAALPAEVAPADELSGSFPELEIDEDEDDSFLDELEDL